MNNDFVASFNGLVWEVSQNDGKAVCSFDNEDDAVLHAEKLNAQDQGKTTDALVADFVEWSGGFGPEECELDEVNKYVEISELNEEQAAILRDAQSGNY